MAQHMTLPSAFMREDRGRYTVEMVQIGGHNAYLLLPEKSTTAEKKFPAVLVLHDHGGHFAIGKEKMVYPLWRTDCDSLTNELVAQDAIRWTVQCYNGMFVGDSLAKQGYVVLVTDALYWGEQAVEQPPFTLSLLKKEAEGIGGMSEQDGIVINPATCRQQVNPKLMKVYDKRMKTGQPAFYEAHMRETGEAVFETILRQDKDAISYLLSLPYVDKKKIFSFGFSMGAYRSWQLAAEDRRVAGCAASNWMTTIAYTGGFITGESSWSMYRPVPKNKREKEVDYPIIASKIRKRPFLLMYGLEDHVLPREGTEQAIATIRKRYHSSEFEAVAFPNDHEFTDAHFHALLQWLHEQTTSK